MDVNPPPSLIAPFRIRNFRLQWPADLATSWAYEMELLVLGWYMLTETNSVFLLTVFGSVVFVGTLFAPLFGVAADRLGHRNVMCAMRAFYTLVAMTLTMAILTGAITPAIVLALTFLISLVRASDIAMRSALVAETMPPSLLAGAFGISRTTMDSARIAGALTGAGLFAALGLGTTYIVITSLYLIGFVLTLAINPTERGDGAVRPAPVPEARPSVWRELGAGLAYVWRNGHLQAAMWLAFLVNLTAFPLTSGPMPYVAREIYGTDQTGLGHLIASFASGALVGSLLLGAFGRRVQAARMMIVCAVIWYALLIVFTQTNTKGLGMVLLFLIGLAQSCSMVPLVILLMRTSDQSFRGRVMGVRMLAIYSLPIGLLLAGALIERFGYPLTALIYASSGLAVIGLIAIRWRKDIWPAVAVGNAT